MSDCLFCKIVKGDIPSTKVYEDEWVYAFKDIQPEAPVHILIVPKVHLDSIAKASEKDVKLLGHIQLVAAEIARSEGLEEAGYRLVTNIGEDGGQTVQHLHYHLLGGRTLKWPPG
ncbi:HIT domain-containing protein [Fusibacter tunisiensis]|uniref:Histidine triad (HIT) family protein n=1 Tax=Fusibacter tunisiensis TaxID=1008308 RepID=A0ABS2MMU0_9FIRM|nr:histidine triad (HIT) family protein [Fusibacter tunisiensis]